MANDPLLEKARAFATRVHSGQTDKGGHPYLDHPIRVAASLRREGHDAVIAAMLHDAIEDGGISATELRAEGFPEAAVHAVDIVTKRDGEHGDEDGYRRFIEHVDTSGLPLVVIVKLGLVDSSDLSRLSWEPGEKDLARALTYERSLPPLLDALHLSQRARGVDGGTLIDHVDEKAS